MILTIADNVTSTVSTTYPTMMGLTYDQYLGVTSLSNGINIRYEKNLNIIFNAILKNVGDWMFSGGRITAAMADQAGNTHITLSIIFPTVIPLDSRNNDKFIVTLSDDLSGLLLAKMSLRGKEEVILFNTDPESKIEYKNVKKSSVE